MKRLLIVGASGGIGTALCRYYSDHPEVEKITATFHSVNNIPSSKVIESHQLDCTDEQQVAELLEKVGELDIVINASGILHDKEHRPDKSIKQIDNNFFMHSLTVNTLSTLNLAKYIGKNFNHDRQSVFASISAKVGSIEDNRLGGWTAYRCSKAALNMALKNISIEWRRSYPNVCVASLHPGTTDTALSEPFQKNVPKEKLFSPDKTAKYLAAVIDKLEPNNTGKFWSWDGSELPW